VFKNVYDAELSDYPLQPVEVILCKDPHSRENYYTSNLDLIVVEGNLPALFGQDWLSRIRVDWKDVFKV